METTTFLFLPLSHPSLPSSSASSPPSSPPPPPPPPPPSTTPTVSHRMNILVTNVPSWQINDDAWSCLVILLTFWFFAASMTLILGFYGAVDLTLGPNCSRNLQANPLFVQDVKLKADEESSKHGPMLYGFYEPPLLDVLTKWSVTRNVSVPSNFHQEWIYYLNKGSHIEISYDVKLHGSYPLILVIAQGKESLVQWMEQPSHPNTTLSWSLIHGNGKIQQTIEKPSDYYIAVGNLNNIETEVELIFNIQSITYNTSGAYYKCSLNHRICSLNLFLERTNVAILTTPTPDPSMQIDEWYVKLTYGPRWLTYFVGSGVMTILIFVGFQVFSTSQNYSQDGTAHQTINTTTERSPLLSNKDDDDRSLGSSYESVSHDEEDINEPPEAGSDLPKDSEIGNFQHLCTICCDVHRDCFFLPCGHCVVCLACGTRILDEAGTCPICRRKIKKVRKIFTI
ncbi:E3 ubiquitin-protein ligase APD2-like isoform X1 [Zingiber officinale]|uniref:E3 ubiquitin-protein ligase APD2-like isoform X1 n=1 Tax=Zingiber officinale TaxID=94328 RepID=UPI001C4D0A87|nr:E3 ubiquitin-protein ligase APD2-like isoform X1 [Zingiber officinale]